MSEWKTTQHEDFEVAQAALAWLVSHGWLVGVQVFGEDDCCEHGLHGSNDSDDCRAKGYGLCDTYHEPWSYGSDCNRAVRFLMRPVDALMSEFIAQQIEDQ